MIQDVGFEESELIDAHVGAIEIGEKISYSVLEEGHLVLMLLPYLFSQVVNSVNLDVLSQKAQKDQKNPFKGEIYGIVDQSFRYGIPFNDLDQGVHQKTQFMEKGISQLNAFVVEFYILA